MATIVVCIICIALIVLGGMTLSQGILTSADTAALSFDRMITREGDLMRTSVTALRAEYLSWSDLLRVTVDNSGQYKLNDYDKWDLFVRYDNGGSSFSEWLPYTEGTPGEQKVLRLELKLVADVGLVGYPNAGKSTLLRALTAARPKTAPYPFTTLQPNLGLVTVDDEFDFVLADLPGLIEGAHAGAGLGHQFLRHVERTRLLIHILDGAAPDPLHHFEQINQELFLFNPILADRPQIVVLNKMDLLNARQIWPRVQVAMEGHELPAYAISAATGEGVRELMIRVGAMLSSLPKPEPAPEAIPIYRLEEGSEFTVEREEGGWRVRGERVERLAVQTMWEYHDGAQRAQRVLEAMGVLEALRQAGVQPEDTVRIGDVELEWLW